MDFVHSVVDLLGFGISEQGLTCCAVDDVVGVVVRVEVPPVLVQLKQEALRVCGAGDGCAVVHGLAPDEVVDKDFEHGLAVALVKIAVLVVPN